MKKYTARLCKEKIHLFKKNTENTRKEFMIIVVF